MSLQMLSDIDSIPLWLNYFIEYSIQIADRDICETAVRYLCCYDVRIIQSRNVLLIPEIKIIHRSNHFLTFIEINLRTV